VNKERLRYLFAQYISHEIARPELMELMTYISGPASNKELEELLLTEWKSLDGEIIFNTLQSKKILHKIMSDPKFRQGE
jgi:hypothetical protein